MVRRKLQLPWTGQDFFCISMGDWSFDPFAPNHSSNSIWSSTWATTNLHLPLNSN